MSDHKGTDGEGIELGKGERDWSFLSSLDGTFVLELHEQHKNNFKIWRQNLPLLKQLLSGKVL